MKEKLTLIREQSPRSEKSGDIIFARLDFNASVTPCENHYEQLGLEQ